MKDDGIFPLPSLTPTITAIARGIYNSKTTAKEWHVAPPTYALIRDEGRNMRLNWDENPVVIHGVTIKPFGAD